jgi:hypothetical protein
VRVSDAAVLANGQPYIVMAYLRGRDLFFKGCTSVRDSIYIDSNTVDNLDALSALESIGGDLVHRTRVKYPLGPPETDTSHVRLTSLSGLAHLRQVFGLTLRQLPLTDLRGHEQLQSTRLTIEGMRALQSLEGLGKRGSYPQVTLSKLPALERLVEQPARTVGPHGGDRADDDRAQPPLGTVRDRLARSARAPDEHREQRPDRRV